MTVKLIRFRREHFVDLVLRENQECATKLRDKIAYYAEGGYSFTVIVDDKIILCGGISDLWAGVGEAWMVTSVDFDKHVKSAVKIIKKVVKDVMPSYHRLQITVQADYAKAVTFANFLGFKEEGVMENYDMFKNNHIRMAITNG